MGKDRFWNLMMLSQIFIHVLPYVPPEYINIKNVPIDFDSRYNLPRKFLFYPAQFWEHKNHHNLLAALAHLKRELKDIHVVLVDQKKCL